MTGRRGSGVRAFAVGTVLLLATACVGLESIGDLATAGGVYNGNRQLSGEIRSVDTRRQEIQVQSSWGRTERVRYDGRTQVRYQQRNYAVRDLERGDVVRMRVESNRNGEPYTDYVEVQRSVREGSRPIGGARVQRLDGTVNRIDTQRGWFELRDSRGSVVTVTLPYEPSRAVRDQFRRLRRGDRVRIEGEVLNASRVELRRFL